MKVFTIAMHKDGKLTSASFELISTAKSIGGELITAVLSDNAEPLANELASRGGGKVLAVSHESLKLFNDEIYAKVLSRLLTKWSPDVVLGPASVYGKSLVARLAAKNGYAMASDATGLRIDGDQLVVTRPTYGGSVLSDVVVNDSCGPYFVTVRGKVFSESKDGAGEVVNETVEADAFESKMTVKESRVESGGTVSLNEADVIVSAGRGIKNQDNLQFIADLAKALGGAQGASRAIVDAEWAPYSQQVGQTGKTVNPKLYIAVGISGAIQHLVGMISSGTIVAVNKDKDAPIFNIANYGIVGDAMEIVPALTNKFKAELS